jgi:hypothetical protein
MSKGEKSLFVIPAADMQAPSASSSNSSSKQPEGLRTPALPAKCVQVEAVVELQDLVQVRFRAEGAAATTEARCMRPAVPLI